MTNSTLDTGLNPVDSSVTSAVSFDPLQAGTLVELLTGRAQVQPTRAPFIFLGNGDQETDSLTYAQTDLRARAIGAHLRTLVDSGERALLLYAPGLAFNEAFYGCLYAGVIAVPVAPPQVSKLAASLARLRAIVESSGATALLTTSDIAAQLTPVLEAVEGFGHLLVVATDTVDSGLAVDWSPPRIGPDTVAYLQYSSGSTGLPKGVVLTHRNVLCNNNLVGEHVRLDATSRGVCWLPTFHDMGLLSAVTQPLFGDYPMVTMSPLAFVQRPMRWLTAMTKYRATHTVAPNFAYALAVRRTPAEKLAELDLSHLRVALCGAEPIRSDTMVSFTEHFAAAGLAPNALFPCYGLAEATLFVTGGPVDGGLVIQSAEPEALARNKFVAVTEGGRELVASGRIDCGSTVVIAEPGSLAVLPDGQIGEICVAGDSIGSGYWAEAEQTALTFGAVIGGRGGFLRTGDLGFVHDGQLYVTGRHKDLIIVDGANHYPTDIEATAMRSHPAVRENRCAAFQLDDHSTAKLVLVAELDRGWRVVESMPDHAEPLRENALTPIVLADVAHAVRTAIGESHGVRLHDVVLVKAGTIKLTSSGKIQRYAARESYLGNDLSRLN